MDTAQPRASDPGVPPPGYLRYRVKMKKTIRKLVIRRETLRALDSKDLTHAVGGTDALQRETRATCPAPAVVASVACGD